MTYNCQREVFFCWSGYSKPGTDRGRPAGSGRLRFAALGSPPLKRKRLGGNGIQCNNGVQLVEQITIEDESCQEKVLLPKVVMN